MKKILEFQEFIDRESKTRTRGLGEQEFLEVFRENCKNFSFDNDMLWRNSNNFGDFGLFFEEARRGTIGTYNYKDFFDDRKDYTVPRYKSLIGSTTKEGAEAFASDTNTYIVIPFDGANIVFSCTPDLALLAKTKQEFSDSLFLLKQYDTGFKSPVSELFEIMSHTTISSYRDMFVKRNLGFEYFTNANCLMIKEDKIGWLKNNI
jgi:hypothetical protein